MDIASLMNLTDRAELENVGKTLDVAKALEVLNFFQDHISKSDFWKLSALFVGLPHEVFDQILLYASDAQLKALKLEGMGEPILHHMTIFCHEMHSELMRAIDFAELTEQTIDSLNPADMSLSEMEEWQDRIEEFALQVQQLLGRIEKGLILVWYTDNVNLIDKLSRIKESSYKFLVMKIGHPRLANLSPTGLYKYLENQLFQFLGDPDNEDDVQALAADESALEGLVKFNIWYLEDYVNLGLLPRVGSLEELDRQVSHAGSAAQLRRKLFLDVKNNLDALGLSTIKDLKQAGIFSKKALAEFLSRQGNLPG